MNWGMEILPNSSWLDAAESCKSPTKWTQAENKAFENALALYDKDTPDRWEKVAEMVPGKTVTDVISQYRELEEDVSCIEAGLMDLPPLAPTSTSPFTLDYWGGGGGGLNLPGRSFPVGGKRPPSNRTPEQERKKGVPWTEEEHRLFLMGLFLMGLKKYGKGDWRNISRNFVISRTPTQVASHAQKYFIRQLSGGKDKRRASIHDITTVNLNEEQIRSPESKKPPYPASASPGPQETNSGVQKMPLQWNNNGAVMGSFSTGQGNFFGTPPYGVGSFGIMNRVQQGSAALQEIYFGPQRRAL